MWFEITDIWDLLKTQKKKRICKGETFTCFLSFCSFICTYNWSSICLFYSNLLSRNSPTGIVWWNYVCVMIKNMPSSQNRFQSFISGSVHKVLKYNRKYKIMFNKKTKKKTTQCLFTIFINNKDSFLNISYSEVFDCLYFWIYIFKFCRFLFTKVFLFSSKDSEFSFSKP